MSGAVMTQLNQQLTHIYFIQCNGVLNDWFKHRSSLLTSFHRCGRGDRYKPCRSNGSPGLGTAQHSPRCPGNRSAGQVPSLKTIQQAVGRSYLELHFKLPSLIF